MQFDISSANSSADSLPLDKNDTTAVLLKEILEVQRQILTQLRASTAAQDSSPRWRSLLDRWSRDYPELPDACRKALPVLERAYGGIVAGLVDELGQDDEDSLDNEFTLQDFLDRYGMRLGQLGNILNLVGPLAEASSQKQSSQ